MQNNYYNDLNSRYNTKFLPTHPYTPDRNKIAFHIQADSEMYEQIFLEQQIQQAREQELYDSDGEHATGKTYAPSAYDPTVDPVATVENIEFIVKPTQLVPHPLQIWYDASDTTQLHPTNLSDGDNITQWEDKSRHAHNAHPTHGQSKPQYSFNQLNGRPVVVFDGVDDDLAIHPVSVFTSALQCTIYMLIYYDPASFGKTIMVTNTGELRLTTTSHDFGSGVVDSFAFEFTPSVASVAVDFNINTAGWYKIGMIYDGTQPSSDRVKIRINDTSPSTQITGVIPAVLSSQNNKFSIGTNRTHTSHWPGKIAELMVFNKAIDSTETVGLEDFIDLHWDL